MSHATLLSPRKGLAAHMAETDHFGLFNRGAVNAKGIVSFLDLSKADVGTIAGVRQSVVRYDRQMPQAVAQRLTEIANIANLVGDYFEGDADKVHLWFKLPNPGFGNVSPRDLIRMGHYQKVLDFVLEARRANTVSAESDRQLPLDMTDSVSE